MKETNTHNKTEPTMKVTKDSIKSEIIYENDVAYIYQSVTPYDEYQDTVEFAVSTHEGETVGRFEDVEEAITEWRGL